MEKETFKKLWKDLALIEIQKTIASFQEKNGLRVSQRESDVELRDNTYSRYESERINFRDTANVKEKDLMDRHKIAAWLYSAFVFRTDKINCPWLSLRSHFFLWKIMLTFATSLRRLGNFLLIL